MPPGGFALPLNTGSSNVNLSYCEGDTRLRTPRLYNAVIVI